MLQQPVRCECKFLIEFTVLTKLVLYRKYLIAQKANRLEAYFDMLSSLYNVHLYKDVRHIVSNAKAQTVIFFFLLTFSDSYLHLG